MEELFKDEFRVVVLLELECSYEVFKNLFYGVFLVWEVFLCMMDYVFSFGECNLVFIIVNVLC